MEKVVLHSKGLNDLDRVAEEIVKLFDKYKIISFSGPMGAGKTTLIKRICSLLNVQDSVSSPTYSLVNEYQTQAGNTVYHFDFYRIQDEEEALDMGVDEYFYSDHLCLIEWPERIINLLPDQILQVKINLEKNERIFNLEVP